MTKDEARLSVMNAISMALKDSTLQRGFEIICKNLSELENENTKLKEQNRSYEQLLDKGSVTLMKERLKNYKQLIKTKDIIKALLDFDFLPETDIKKRAEQFLKEE